jgi:isopenicillin N synthase-like dioxygenase
MISYTDPPRLPTIDLSLFDVGDPWRDHVAAQVDWAANTFGLFQILGHGVDPALIDTLLELGEKYVALEGGLSHRSAGPDLPGFQDTVREYATTMTGLGHKLMTTMARGLHLVDSFFVDRYSGNPVTKLSIHDYPVMLPGRRAFAADEAGDRGLLTIVKLGESGGQQVRLNDQWVDVPALPQALLCYVGPVLERLTAGRYVSATHRLSRADLRLRPSVSFSFEPGPDAVLTPVLGAGVPPSLHKPAGRYVFEARC